MVEAARSNKAPHIYYWNLKANRYLNQSFLFTKWPMWLRKQKNWEIFTLVISTLFVKSNSFGSISYSGTSRACVTCIGAILFAVKNHKYQSKTIIKTLINQRSKSEANNANTYRRLRAVFLQKLDQVVVLVIYSIREGLFCQNQNQISNSVREEKAKDRIGTRSRALTVLPQRSLRSTSAPRSSKSETTSVRPWQAATWRAVRPSMSLKLTLMPESRSSLIPSTSPPWARYIKRTPGSIPSATSSPSVNGSSLNRSGAIDDCFPSVNRIGGFGDSMLDVRIFPKRLENWEVCEFVKVSSSGRWPSRVWNRRGAVVRFHTFRSASGNFGAWL